MWIQKKKKNAVYKLNALQQLLSDPIWSWPIYSKGTRFDLAGG